MVPFGYLYRKCTDPNNPLFCSALSNSFELISFTSMDAVVNPIADESVAAITNQLIETANSNSESSVAPLFSYIYSDPLVEIISGNIHEVSKLDLSEEMIQLQDGLSRKVMSDIPTKGHELRWEALHATSENFTNSFSNCTILHFSGHGKDGTCLFF